MKKFIRELDTQIDGTKLSLRNSRLNDYYEKWLNEIFYDDIFLVSFPRSGNTWARFLLTGLYLWVEREGMAEPNYFNIQTYIPDIHLGSIGSYRPVAGLPRIIKSHRAYTPNYPRVIYLVRDVRDALISGFHFVNRYYDYFPSFERFLQDRNFGAFSWKRHVESWLDSAARKPGRLLLVRYEDMLDDPIIQLKRILAFLNITISKDSLTWIVNMADKNRLRQLEATFSRPRPAPVSAIRKGEKGEWNATLSKEQQEYIYKVAGPALEKCHYSLDGSN